MLSTFAQFSNRLIRTSTSSQRPSSLSYSKPGVRQTYSSYSSIRQSKQSAIVSQQGSKIRFSNRSRPQSEFKYRLRTVSNFDALPKMSQDYRLQIINPHCLKKVPMKEPQSTLNVLKNHRSVFGEGLGLKKAQRKYFLGKKLKCLKAKDSRRFYTLPDDNNCQKFEINGLRIS